MAKKINIANNKNHEEVVKNMKNIAETTKQLKEITGTTNAPKYIFDKDALNVLTAIIDKAPAEFTFSDSMELPLNKRVKFNIVGARIGYNAVKNLAQLAIQGEYQDKEIELVLYSRMDPMGQKIFGKYNGGHILGQLNVKGRKNIVQLYQILLDNIGNSLTVKRVEKVVEQDDGTTKTYPNYEW